MQSKYRSFSLCTWRKCAFVILMDAKCGGAPRLPPDPKGPNRRGAEQHEGNLSFSEQEQVLASVVTGLIGSMQNAEPKTQNPKRRTLCYDRVVTDDPGILRHTCGRAGKTTADQSGRILACFSCPLQSHQKMVLMAYGRIDAACTH